MTDTRKSARPLSELDKASRERLEFLLGTEPTGVSQGDKEFLVARRDYLSDEQKKDYGVTAPVAKKTGTKEDDGDKYDDMDKAALKAEAKKRGLPVSGSNEDLANRLRESDAK